VHTLAKKSGFYACFIYNNASIFTGANQKLELPVAAMFVNGSGQNEHQVELRKKI
jgi:hypothetical protein